MQAQQDVGLLPNFPPFSKLYSENTMANLALD